MHGRRVRYHLLFYVDRSCIRQPPKVGAAGEQILKHVAALAGHLLTRIDQCHRRQPGPLSIGKVGTVDTTYRHIDLSYVHAHHIHPSRFSLLTDSVHRILLSLRDRYAVRRIVFQPLAPGEGAQLFGPPGLRRVNLPCLPLLVGGSGRLAFLGSARLRFLDWFRDGLFLLLCDGGGF